MNQTRKIFKNTVVLTAADLIDRAGEIFLIYLISRLLHASGLGVYSAAMSYYGLIAIAGAMGATSFLVREIARDLAKTNRYVIHTSLLGVGISIIMTVLVLIGIPWIPFSAEMRASMYIVLLALIPGVLNTVQESVFVAHQRVEFITATKLISTLVNLLINLLLLYKGFGVVSLLIAFVVEHYLITAFYFYWIHRQITPLRWEIDFAYLPTLVSEVKTFAALSLLAALFSRPEVIMLSIMRDDATVGYYSAAFKIVSLWFLVPQIYMTNVFPVLSRTHGRDQTSFSLIQDKSVKYLCILSFPLAAGVIAAAKPIIEFFNGPGFEPAIPILQMLAPTIPLNALLAVFWRVLAARNQQHLDLQSRIITTLARLLTGPIFIFFFALFGAAISTTVSIWLSTIMLLRNVNQQAPKLDLWRLSWRSFVASTCMGVIIWFISTEVSLWLLVPSAAALYALFVLLFQIFSEDDLSLFRALWRPQVADRG